MAPSTALFSIPFPLTLRNFIPTGLAAQVSDRLGLDVHLISPYSQERFTDPQGQWFQNHSVTSYPGSGGLPNLHGITPIDRLFKSIHLSGFAIEYPDGSLQNITLSARRNPQWMVARVLTSLMPRRSKRRAWLRQIYGLYRPRRSEVASVFDRVNPAFVLTASPGHIWLDHFVIDEAKRRRIPSICIILSWDNLYSRGPLCRRPDVLMVWSEEMKQQAIEVHQFPAEWIRVVGALQFSFYETPVSEEELAHVRARIGLAPNEAYLAYICGARTSEYDVEDVLAIIEILQTGQFKNLRIVVRPHPQGSRAAYNALSDCGVLLDNSLDLTSEESRPDAFDLGAIRHMASLLCGAEFVVSSWGTTALLEACIFDRPAVQLRWMDSVMHRNQRETQMVRDFQRYIHMRAFDATGARLYCDSPSELNAVMLRLKEQDTEFRAKRALAVSRLACLPLEGVVERVCTGLEHWVLR